MKIIDTKKAINSLTIRAGLVGAIASIASAFGIHIAPDILPQAEAVITGLAALVAIYGRYRANTIIQ